jgi:hypothetical protein
MALALVAAACAKDSNSGPTGDGTVTLPNGTFRGTVNGFAHTPISVNVIFDTFSGILSLSTATAQGFSIGWGFVVSGPGTYSIAQTQLSYGSYTQGFSSWRTTAFEGGSGTLRLNVVSGQRVAGDFSFSMFPIQGTQAVGFANIEGVFDIRPM